MTLEEIRELAHVLEIQSVAKFDNKADLIKTIQLAEGGDDCFGQVPECPDNHCVWHEDCRHTAVA